MYWELMVELVSLRTPVCGVQRTLTLYTCLRHLLRSINPPDQRNYRVSQDKMDHLGPAYTKKSAVATSMPQPYLSAG